MRWQKKLHEDDKKHEEEAVAKAKAGVTQDNSQAAEDQKQKDAEKLAKQEVKMDKKLEKEKKKEKKLEKQVQKAKEVT